MPTIAELCEQHQITVDQLTEKTQLEADRVLAIMLGRWTPSPAERTKIAAVFNLQPTDIAWGHKTPIQHIWGY